jgi:hypothetical protein
MEDNEVRIKWDIVEEKYLENKHHSWLRLAMEWSINEHLSKIFPLLKKYGKIRQYYEPNARLFVHAIVLTNVYLMRETRIMGYDDVVVHRRPSVAVLSIGDELPKIVEDLAARFTESEFITPKTRQNLIQKALALPRLGENRKPTLKEAVADLEESSRLTASYSRRNVLLGATVSLLAAIVTLAIIAAFIGADVIGLLPAPPSRHGGHKSLIPFDSERRRKNP